jgi:hypothetical protein
MPTRCNCGRFAFSDGWCPRCRPVWARVAAGVAGWIERRRARWRIAARVRGLFLNGRGWEGEGA